ncbi:MAG: glycosyltransferase family 4 protein [Casimicrobiaceae bacterium]
MPNDRSLHVTPVPRIGGAAIWAGWLAAWLVAPGSGSWLVPIGCVLLISLIDDWRGLPAALRLTFHLGAALAVSAPYHDVLTLSGATVTVFDAMVIVWMANLYNFMDGADGLAGGTGAIGFGAYGIALWLAGAPGLATLCAALAVSCAAFLVFNTPPARLFMGDVGAVGLGFVAGLIGLHGYSQDLWAWWFPPLVFLPFIADSTSTLIRRWHRGESPARAHRDHFYQRAILLDGSHQRTLLTYMGWATACGIAAVLCQRAWPEIGAAVLVAAAAAFAWYCRSIDRRWAGYRDPRHAG